MHGTVELTREIAALIKGMLVRGDKQSDIAACFLINGGRVAEINKGQRYTDVAAAAPEELPPPPPYPSPYEAWKLRHSLWAARVVVDTAREHLEKIADAIENAENRFGKK